MKRSEREGGGEIKRRIAAATAAATIAVSGSAAATGNASTRGGHPRLAPRTTPLARSADGAGARTTDALRRGELAAHRRLLAQALAAELDGVEAANLERGMARVDDGLAAAYRRDDRSAFAGGLTETLATQVGADEGAIERAFDSMARHALQRRLGGASRGESS